MLYINNEMTYYLCAQKEKKKKWLIICGIVSCIVELTLRTNLELALVGADSLAQVPVTPCGSGQDAPWGTTGEQCIEIFTKMWVLDKVPRIDLDHDLMIRRLKFFVPKLRGGDELPWVSTRVSRSIHTAFWGKLFLDATACSCPISPDGSLLSPLKSHSLAPEYIISFSVSHVLVSWYHDLVF